MCAMQFCAAYKSSTTKSAPFHCTVVHCIQSKSHFGILGTSDFLSLIMNALWPCTFTKRCIVPATPKYKGCAYNFLLVFLYRVVVLCQFGLNTFFVCVPRFSCLLFSFSRLEEFLVFCMVQFYYCGYMHAVVICGI